MDLIQLFLYVFVNFYFVATQNQPFDEDLQYYCGSKPADIVFLLDTSNSIWTPDLRRQMRFVENVVAIFEIGENTTRVGVATYSTWAHTEINLNDYFDKKDLLAAIRDIKPRRGFRTNTAEAIRHMRHRMFKHNHGGRNPPKVARVAIVLTDGKSSRWSLTIYEALRAKRHGIHLFVIGIGSLTNPAELKGMSSSPTSENYFHVNNFAALDSIKKELAVKTCKVEPPTTTTSTTTTTTTTTIPTTTPTTTTTTPTTTTTTPTTTTTTPTTTTTTPTTTTTSLLDVAVRVCQTARADLVLAFDSSDAITKPEFYKQIQFADDIIINLQLGPNQTRVAAVLYTDQVQNIMDLNDHYNWDIIRDSLNQVQMSGGGSRIDEALWYIRTKTFRRSVARRGVAQVVILFTGKQSIYPGKTKLQASKTRNSGIIIIPIAVNRGFDGEEIRAIAGPSEHASLYELASFGDLKFILADIALEICSAPIPSLPIADQACGTRQEADLMFLLDSINAGRKNSKKALTFIQTLLDYFYIAQNGIQIGIMSAECQGQQTGFNLSSHANKDSVIKALSNVEATDFSKILHQMRRGAFSKENGGRKDAKKIAVLIIDGDLEEPIRALREARRARIHGIDIYVIQVGNQVPQEEIILMSDEPTEQHFFQITEYDELKILNKRITQALCNEL